MQQRDVTSNRSIPDHTSDGTFIHAKPNTRLPRWRHAFAALALITLAAALWLATDRQAVMEWKKEAGPLPFFIAMAILPVIGLPITPFFVVAGALYGPWVGLTGSTAAIAANLAICYAISKSALRPWLERLIVRTRFTPPDFRASRAKAVRFTLLVKITPGLPTFAKNYLLGMAGVPFSIYFAVSFAFTFVYAASFIVLGDSILDRNWTAGGIALGLLAIVGGALFLIRLRRKRQQPTKSNHTT